MTASSIKSRLEALQDKTDDNTNEYVEEDFKLKHKSHKKIQSALDERDNILTNEMSREELCELYENAAENFTAITDFFPLNGNKRDCSFLKMLKAEYLDSGRMKVVMELFDNEYVENKTLTKVMHLGYCKPETTKVLWKSDKVRCHLFEFFENDEDDFESFDIFYEFYMNLYFLAQDLKQDE